MTYISALCTGHIAPFKEKKKKQVGYQKTDNLCLVVYNIVKHVDFRLYICITIVCYHYYARLVLISLCLLDKVVPPRNQYGSVSKQ